LCAPRRAEHLICDINGKAQLDILEVTSNLYKATYRMRFCYLRGAGDCALAGQEIAEVGLQP
jgi:hypothetical protein